MVRQVVSSLGFFHLFLSNSSVLVLFYLIINLNGRGGGEELGRVEAGETRIYYERKKLFSIKKNTDISNE